MRGLCGACQFLLVVECDLSLSTGQSINERESAKVLLDKYSKNCSIIAPTPEYPEEFYDSRIDYVSNHFRHRPIAYLRFLWEVWRRVKQVRGLGCVDAVVFRMGLWPILPILATRMGMPVFLKTLSGYALYARKDKRLPARLVARFMMPFFERAVRGAKGADVPSAALADWLGHRVGADRGSIKVIPNGVNVAAFGPRSSGLLRKEYDVEKFKTIVGYVGALDSIRNVETALSALREFDESAGMGIVLVGDGPHRLALEKYVDDLGVADQVVFLGAQPYTKVPELISGFDVAFDLTRVTLPVGGGNLHASFSQKIPQYLACGVPVVACSSADTEFLLSSDLGVTVDPDIPKAFARAVEYVLSSPEIVEDRDRIRKVAVDKFSYDAVVDQRVRYWVECLDRVS